MIWYCFYTMIFGLSGFHDFHVSTCEINFVEEEQTIQTTLHIFIDDFEKALSPLEALHLFEQNELSYSDSLIDDYLTGHFTIVVDGVEVPLSYLGREMSEDLSAVYIYLESTTDFPFKEVKVHNDILFEVFDDQRTLITIKNNQQKRYSTILDKGETSFVFNW